MSWSDLGQIAFWGVLISLAGALTYILTGLDRWQYDLRARREARERDRFDVFTSGGWDQ